MTESTEQHIDPVNLVAYYRVSDKKQGDGKRSGTGYGIEAQMRDVEFLRQRLGGFVLDSFTEVESGGKDNRPKLRRPPPCARRPEPPWLWRSWIVSHARSI